MNKNCIICAIVSCIALFFLGSNVSLAEGGEAMTIVGIAQGTIVIDGKADDWSGIKPLVQDVGSMKDKRSFSKIDVHEVKVTLDQDYLYFLLEADHVTGESVNVYIDSDGKTSTGTTMSLVENKKFDAGWDYIVKITYSGSSKGGTYLISQVEKIKVIPNGFKSELVFEHKNNHDDAEWVGSTEEYQEFKIPLEVLDIVPPTEVAFFFMEGRKSGFTKYEQSCKFIKAALE